jgi:hypothetical protein
MSGAGNAHGAFKLTGPPGKGPHYMLTTEQVRLRWLRIRIVLCASLRVAEVVIRR